METSTLTLNGTPTLLTWMFVHPWMSFFTVAFLILAIFGTITDVLCAFAKRGKR